MNICAAPLLHSAICNPLSGTASPLGTSMQWPPPCGEICSRVGKPCAAAPCTSNVMTIAEAAVRTDENMTPPHALYSGRDCSPHGAKRNAGPTDPDFASAPSGLPVAQRQNHPHAV